LTRKSRTPPRVRLKAPEKFKPLDPSKPLAPHSVPALKQFDRKMPGQGILDFSKDGPVIVYPEDDEDGRRE
jgi:hypothetical protein